MGAKNDVQGRTNAARGMEKVRPEVEKLVWAMPRAARELMTPPTPKKKRSIGFAPWEEE